MTTAREFLEQHAGRFGFTMTKAFIDGDFDLRVAPLPMAPPFNMASAADLIQLAAILMEAEYRLIFMKDNSIHVHAPHRKEHSWGDRGWTCTHGLTVEGCEKFKTMDEFKDQDTDKLITELQAAIKGRDACVGQLYASIAQSRIDKLLFVLDGRTLTDTQKLRMGLRGRQMPGIR